MPGADLDRRRLHALVLTFLLIVGVAGLLTIPKPSEASAETTLKQTVAGVFDRQHLARPSYLPVVNGAVIKANWKDLQLTPGGPINPDNVINRTIAEARRLNAADPKLNLRLKLRVYAGINAPEWAKNLDGAPVALLDPQTGGAIGTVGRFWTPKFKAAYDDLQMKLAAAYEAEPLILDVVIGRCTTEFNEPFLRQAALKANRDAYLAAGFSIAADKRCHTEQIDTHARVWNRTRSSLALSPYQAIDSAGVRVDEPFTESMMVYCRSMLQSRCVLGNNSLSWPLDDGHYTSMYAKITSLGGPIYYQTATPARIGDWRAALAWAISNGASMVELNTGYDPDYPVADLSGYDVGLEGQSAPDEPTVSSTVPGAPTQVAAARGDAKATVTWAAPASNGGSSITGYTVTASPGGTTATAGSSATSVTVGGLTNGTSYTFTVRATNAVGTSAASAPSTAVTPATVPDAPRSVSAVGGDTKATVSWAAPASNGGSPITSYTVTASPGGATATAGSSATSATVSGLKNGTSYTFTVRASNALGSSASSAASQPVVPQRPKPENNGSLNKLFIL